MTAAQVLQHLKHIDPETEVHLHDPVQGDSENVKPITHIFLDKAGYVVII